ncbi:MAG: hypothetical protein LUH42_05660 [Oscillospiraceae bacterium]|nr:hypothetical protein [Oscillospiraceae bacterium]
MSNYFDNQTNWSWNVSDGKVTVTTQHDQPTPHSHTLDVTNVPIGEMADHTGEIMGDAHRTASHDYATTESNEQEAYEEAPSHSFSDLETGAEEQSETQSLSYDDLMSESESGAEADNSQSEDSEMGMDM